MARLCRTLSRAARPAIALVLVFAQSAAAFGFPLVQTRKTIKACGCVMPCGAASENCCCAKAVAVPAPAAVPKPVRCPKCRDREAPKSPLESAAASSDAPKVTWMASFKVRQCRGESPMGLLAESPAIPPVVNPKPYASPLATETLRIGDTHLVSHFAIPLDPPPRRV